MCRQSLCAAFTAVAALLPELAPVAELLMQLNAVSKTEVWLAVAGTCPWSYSSRRSLHL